MNKTNPLSLDFTKSSWLALKTGLTKSSILFCFFVFFSLCVGLQNARGQTLGTYSNTSVVSGKNTVITPSAAPTGTTSAVAYTNSNFTGILTVNPTTGDVTVTDAKQAGTYTVTVLAFGSGTATTTFTLTITNPNCSAGGFTGTTNISVGSNAILVAIADFNGDGKQDFASTNDGSSNVSIRLGDGSGGFSGTTNIGVGTNPRSVAIGDFNGDGKQDFAAANHGSGTVSIRLGNGSGGFSGSTNISVGSNPRSVAIGDFNGDGKQDFAAANEGTHNVSISLGNGSGGFSATTNISVGNGPISVAIGDFNGDGKQDFATANYSSSNVSIRLGNGSGGFSGTTNISVGTTPFSVAIGDFNGDAKQDFAAANYSSGNVSIRLGDGSGGFTGSTNIGVETNPYSVAIGDFNGDGKQDFAAANQNSSSVSIRLGNGSGGFTGTTNVGVPNGSTSVAIGDFNGDGMQDFAAANYSSNVSIRLGLGNEINVQGNSVNIVDGDVTPSTSDHTDFGNGVFSRTFTIQNTGNASLTLGANAVTITGANAADFSVNTQPATSVAAAVSTTFVINFSLTASGVRNATVNIANNDCDESPYNFDITALGCTSPTVPTLNASSSSICGNQSSTLSISSGTLNSATNWQWYSTSCGGTSVGSGTSVNVSPVVTTTYYARGEGGCVTPGSCSNITITVTGPGVPTGANVYSGNITISTQTQMDAFFNSGNGKKYTKISGLLTLNGNHFSDPITSLCNLSSLVEITGNLNINNFNKAANPTSLYQLAALTTLGCGLNITSNSLLQDATLASLSSIGCSVNIIDNNALQTINMPELASVQGGQFYIKNNPKLEMASASTTAGSFSFTGKGSSIDISDNGSTAAGALAMNFKKVTTLKGALVFHNNDNTGVSNFDNIFTGLTDLSTKWGKLTITNNDYLGTCCIAASVTVGGSGKRHIISGNTGNCVDSATVLANCGVFHKKSSLPAKLNSGFVEFKVYPNPSSGIFNLDVMSNQTGQLNLVITDMMGRTILTETHAISQFTSLPISLKTAASGTYFLKAKMNGEVFVKRISIVR
jgi:hypothetical protein